MQVRAIRPGPSNIKLMKEYTSWRQFLAWIGFITLCSTPLITWYLITLVHNVQACLALA